jgi:hypothetical protein
MEKYKIVNEVEINLIGITSDKDMQSNPIKIEEIKQ